MHLCYTFDAGFIIGALHFLIVIAVASGAADHCLDIERRRLDLGSESSGELKIYPDQYSALSI